eukprot:TRINITY_DN52010_c0_g1_i1.p2 TRINITY_DN52010_c0_g1~~TRINITY_DN52010_c0_g1_i1.p2  ORF type:complete len:115 (+),score=11.38 TRINITY_DN52010_c0_g1_i1:64-408(+)
MADSVLGFNTNVPQLIQQWWNCVQRVPLMCNSRCPQKLKEQCYMNFTREAKTGPPTSSCQLQLPLPTMRNSGSHSRKCLGRLTRMRTCTTPLAQMYSTAYWRDTAAALLYMADH